MARPQKKGLDYFPHDTDLSSDDKLLLLEADHGMTGYAVYVKLLEKIYREGYFLYFDDRVSKLFSRLNGIEIAVCEGILKSCLQEGLFDKKIYNKFKILTSHGIQKRYLEACRRKRKITLNDAITLVDV
ncbi:MAG: DUF4373 domain-containing protein, partial [Caldithrix sp.]|nr:DUF4373 domain-containing protein [Caldithrix sp.]